MTHLNVKQRIQHSAACINSGKQKTKHISPVLRELHWLRVVARIKFKIGVFVYKALHNQFPEYLSDLCTQANQIHYYALQLLTHHDLVLTRFIQLQSTRAIESFPMWLRISGEVYQPLFENQTLVTVFCCQLNTVLYEQSFGSMQLTEIIE
jgi:hypothetical protein